MAKRKQKFNQVKQALQKIENLDFEFEFLNPCEGIQIDIDVKLAGSSIEITKKIEEALTRALIEVADELEGALKAGVKAAGVYDTGALLESGNVTVSGTTLTIDYDVPYAALQHYGGYVQPYGNPNAQPVFVPGRPWITNTLESFDLGAALKRYMRAS